MKREKPTSEELNRMYWDEQHSLSKIGKKYDVNSCTVSRWMKSYGLNIRDINDAKSVRIPSKKELESLYEKGYLNRQIAKHYGVSVYTVTNWINRRKIIRRSPEQTAVLREDVKWKTLEEWEEFGTKSRFSIRPPSSLKDSKNKTERSWYVKGRDKKWLVQFDFQRIREDKKWGTEEEWREWGLDRNYNLKNPNGVIKSKNKDDRRWYNCGQRRGWLNSFSFERKQIEGRWGSVDEWILYGLEKNYHQRNPTSLQRSNEEEDRDWYSRGLRMKWLGQFNFQGSKTRLPTEKLRRLMKKELSKLFNEEGLSIKEIAEKIGVSEKSVRSRLNKLNIRQSKKVQRNVANGLWKDLEFTLERAESFLKEHPEYEELPPMGVISRTVGYSSLVASIIKYHGGFPVFRQRLNEYLGRQPEEQQSLLETYVSGGKEE